MTASQAQSVTQAPGRFSPRQLLHFRAREYGPDPAAAADALSRLRVYRGGLFLNLDSRLGGARVAGRSHKRAFSRRRPEWQNTRTYMLTEWKRGGAPSGDISDGKRILSETRDEGE